MKPPHLLSILLLAAQAVPAAAHHGDNFFLVEDYEMADVWDGHLSGSFDWEKFNGLDTFTAENSIYLTVAPRIGLSISTDFSDDGDGWGYTSVTPRVHVQLTPPKWELPVRISLSVGYQFVDGAAGHANRKVSVTTYENILETVPCGCSASTTTSVPTTQVITTTTTVPATSTSTGGGSGTTPVCDPLTDVDCPTQPPHTGHDDGESTSVTTTTQTTSVASSASGSSSSSTGSGTTTKVKKVKHVQQVVVDPDPPYNRTIHNHDQNLWTSRLIIEADLGRTTALFNLIAVSPEGEPPAWGYAAGIRREITHSLGIGVEAIGDFASDGMHEMVVGAYINPTHSITMKIGAGFGLTEASSDFSIRTGVIYRF